MSGPNAELMELYSTDGYYLEKCGALPTGALRAVAETLAPIAFLSSVQKDKERQARLAAEAEIMNRMLRAEEHARMSPVLKSLGHPTDVIPPEIQYISDVEKTSSVGPSAEDVAKMIGARLANDDFEKVAARNSAFEKLAEGVPYDELTEMEKEAIGFLGGIAKALGGAVKSVGGAVGRTAGRARLGVGAKLTDIGGARKGLIPKILSPEQQSSIAARGMKMESAGEQMVKRYNPVVGRQQQSVQVIKKVPTEGGFRTAPGTTTTSTGSVSAPRDVRQVDTAPKPAVTPGVNQPAPISTPTPTPAAQAAGDTAKSKGGLGWKGKAVLGLGAAGLAYGGYKGLQSARDYMMIPSYTGGMNWGGYGMPLRRDVNQYGYTQPMI